ncbi:hypothetical protein HYV43_04285 [Candidatus Micrarchaeota archaeon]|nr:hypothetical protein [Candidatus Micrarchaeota archaeon]
MEPSFQKGTIRQAVREMEFLQEPLVLYHDLPANLKKRPPGAEIRLVHLQVKHPVFPEGNVPVLALEMKGKGVKKGLTVIGMPHYDDPNGVAMKKMAHYRFTPEFARQIQELLVRH